MNLRLSNFFFLLALLSFFSFSQSNPFEDYKTVLSEGAMPDFFTKALQEESEVDREYYSEIGEEKLMDYLQYNHYGLKFIMGSGSVLYGDPMSQFVNKVAEKLLVNQPKVLKDLQFFVLNTNYTNALCMEPGVIFITTGLLAQIENEAQLAYILAHEISHYKEKHFQRAYVETGKDINKSKISYEELAHLSKEHEFEADVSAVKIYHDAGYGFEEIVNVFTVLMYSYLPFDEVEIDSLFFGDGSAYIPSSFFPEKANPIISFEEYDDSKSTHPNIKRRTESIISEIDKQSNWQERTRYFDESEFLLVRNIARFEYVRNDFLEGDYIETLYGIYILEKDFPNNRYLGEIKASTWLQMSNRYINNRKSTFLKGAKYAEGGISKLYGFFKELNTNDISLLAVRVIEDIYKRQVSSSMLSKIRESSIFQLNRVKGLDVQTLEKLSFYEALVLNREENKENDSLVVQDENEEEALSKYEKIKNLQKKQSSSQTVRELIDENFAYFLLNDLVADSEFFDIYNKKEEKEEEEVPKRRARKQRFKVEGNVILLGTFFQAKKHGEFDVAQSIFFEDLADEAIQNKMPADRVEDYRVNLSNKMTTEKYNEFCQVLDYLNYLSEIKDDKLVDLYINRKEIDLFIAKHNNPMLLQINGYSNKPRRGKSEVWGSVKFIDLQKREIHSFDRFRVPMRLGKISVGGLIHEAVSKI